LTADTDEPGRWWRWSAGYIGCATAALHTHYLAVLVLLAQGMFALPWFGARRRWKSLSAYLLGAGATALLFLPWIGFIRSSRTTFYHPELSWIQMAPVLEYFRFLSGDFFWGMLEWFHPKLWLSTTALPLLVLSYCLWLALRNREKDFSAQGGSPRVQVAYLGWLLAGPVLLAAVTSAVYHPIYCRMRFANFVLPSFLALAGLACSSLRSCAFRWLAVAVLAAAMFTGTLVQKTRRLKPDWRAFAKAWKREGPPAETVFFPAVRAIPAARYLDEPVASASREEIEKALPQLEGREIWLVPDIYDWLHDEPGSYFNWLFTLGSVRQIVPPSRPYLLAVRVGGFPVRKPGSVRIDRWFQPVAIPGLLEGFDKESGFSVLEYDGEQERMVRWSTGKAWLAFHWSDRISTFVLSCALRPPVGENPHPDLKFYVARVDQPADLFETAPVRRIKEWRKGELEVELPVPPGSGTVWVGWTVNPVNLARLNISSDARDLGLRVSGLGVAVSRE
jgi:hypothetical protein